MNPEVLVTCAVAGAADTVGKQPAVNEMVFASRDAPSATRYDRR